MFLLLVSALWRRAGTWSARDLASYIVTANRTLAIMSDDLFELRTYFYLGNLAAAATEASTVHVSDDTAMLERDMIMQRLRVARGEFDDVIGSVEDDAAPALQAVKLLASVRKDPSLAETACATVGGWMDDGVAGFGFTEMCAVVYGVCGDFDNALRCAERCGGLEGSVLMVQVLLAMDRGDVAAGVVEKMKAVDEDATLTQLAGAWVGLCSGGEGVQESVYVFRDLLERHGATDMVLNGMAVCYLAEGKVEEAERVLKEALTKNPNCPNTLVNVIASSMYKNKPAELIARYFAQLRLVAPENVWLKGYTEKEAEFDRLAAQISA